MKYFLSLVHGDTVLGSVGADGAIHPHSNAIETLTETRFAADGRIVARAGDLVRVPHPLEDPAAHEEPAAQVELALTDDQGNIVKILGAAFEHLKPALRVLIEEIVHSILVHYTGERGAGSGSALSLSSVPPGERD